MFAKKECSASERTTQTTCHQLFLPKKFLISTLEPKSYCPFWKKLAKPTWLNHLRLSTNLSNKPANLLNLLLFIFATVGQRIQLIRKKRSVLIWLTKVSLNWTCATSNAKRWTARPILVWNSKMPITLANKLPPTCSSTCLSLSFSLDTKVVVINSSSLDSPRPLNKLQPLKWIALEFLESSLPLMKEAMST